MALLLVAGQSQARPVRHFTPNELAERSELIIVGQPTEIKSTKREGSIKLGKNAEVPIVFYTAKVKVIGKVKGDDIPKEITVEFTQVDFTKLAVIVNGPGRFALSKDFTYLLYLKKGEEGTYIGALYGEYDDNQAAVVIAPVEADSKE